MILALTAAACVLGVNQPPPHQSPNSDIRAMFESTWEAAHAFELPRNLLVRYRITEYPRLTDAEVAAIRARIEGKPDHPDRRTLEIELRRRQAPDTTLVTFWYLDEHHWRYSRDESFQDIYIDVADNGEYLWTLTPVSVQVFASNAQAPQNRNVALMRSDAATDIRQFVYAGWGSVPYEQLDILSSSSNTVRVRIPNGSLWSHTVTPVPDGSRLLCERSILLESSFSDGGDRVFSHWDFDETLGQWRCTRIDQRDVDGRLIRTRELLAVETIPDRSSVAHLLVAPVQDNGIADTDALRGGLDSVQTILDFRNGQERIINITDTGIQQSPMPRGMRTPARPFPWSVVGWILAAVLGAGLVAIRILRYGR